MNTTEKSLRATVLYFRTPLQQFQKLLQYGQTAQQQIQYNNKTNNHQPSQRPTAQNKVNNEK
jgi:hypothetical protein